MTFSLPRTKVTPWGSTGSPFAGHHHLGNVTKYPLYITTGRDVVSIRHFNGDPVTDVFDDRRSVDGRSLRDPRDFVMFGFEWPVPPPPPPISATRSRPYRHRVQSCSIRWHARWCAAFAVLRALDKAKTPVAVPPVQKAPFTGAIYFYNGDTLEGIDDPNHIKQMGGTLDIARTHGRARRYSLDDRLQCGCQ